MSKGSKFIGARLGKTDFFDEDMKDFFERELELINKGRQNETEIYELFDNDDFTQSDVIKIALSICYMLTARTKEDEKPFLAKIKGKKNVDFVEKKLSQGSNKELLLNKAITSLRKAEGRDITSDLFEEIKSIKNKINNLETVNVQSNNAEQDSTTSNKKKDIKDNKENEKEKEEAKKRLEDKLKNGNFFS